ncbi:MAG TPA: PAS domain S-box protein, partial [Burkholderiaceae bacterium]|nr:PAS domain S-box protein [Burkholderiaceae bacterium]
DSQGHSLGLIAVISRRPLQQLACIESILQIYAVRAAAELQRQRSEQSLRNREEQYRAIFEGSADSLVVWSPEFKLVDVNKAFTRLYGDSREEVVGRNLAELLPAAYSASRIEKIRRALAGEEGVLETYSLRKSGEPFEVELRYLPIVYRDQPHVLAIGRDISARKEAEQALRLREEQYRMIFESASDAFVLRNSQGRTIDANPAFYRMYGFTREDIAGNGACPAHFPAEYGEQSEAQVRRALDGHQTHLETIALRADGSRFWVDLRVIPISYRGEPHALQVVRDITERRQAEERRAELESQLRQAQKMEAIGQLTGGIAHDFNNILTSIIGYIVLAGERAQGSDDAKLLRHLEQANIAAQRARDLIGQMLAFARRQRGERRVVALGPVVGQAVQLLRATLPSTIDLDHDAPADDVAPVQADAVQLEQVLFNLCINARDAINGRGRIQVRVSETLAGDTRCASCRQPFEHGRWVEISVGDDGSGIGADVMERMFEPFYSTKDLARGSGMGLAMVHGIVHDHGGHLCVASQPGMGSTFRIMLPPACGVQSQAAAGAVAGEHRRPAVAPMHGRVMVVEDQAMVGDFLFELLEGWGLDVVLERNAEAAAVRLADASELLDVLITDQTMPRLTGLELSRLAAQQRPALPIILCTGDASTFEQAELDLCGVRALLRKPIEPETLRALVRELIRA